MLYFQPENCIIIKQAHFPSDYQFDYLGEEMPASCYNKQASEFQRSDTFVYFATSRGQLDFQGADFHVEPSSLNPWDSESFAGFCIQPADERVTRRSRKACFQRWSLQMVRVTSTQIPWARTQGPVKSECKRG